VLGWSVVTPIDLAQWPVLKEYVGRLHKRPSVARALADEAPLFKKEQERHRAQAAAV
jgi:glutathione S-transferase